MESANDFDIVASCRNILASNPSLTKPVAAIESLIALLNTVSSATAHETLEIVKHHSDLLKDSAFNPVPFTTGTDLFTQYIIFSLRELEGDFATMRQHLLTNGRTFIQNAIDARKGVANVGWEYIEEGSRVLTFGASRCVTALLARAAETMRGKFKVYYVRDPARVQEDDRVVEEMRHLGIPVAELQQGVVSHIMGLLTAPTLAIVGAEAITADGGIIARIGTRQIAQLVSDKPKIPFYVAAETHKFTRKLCMDQRDLGFKQDIWNFSTEPTKRELFDEAVDHTHPSLITGLITETGEHLPSYVYGQMYEMFGIVEYQVAAKHIDRVSMRQVAQADEERHDDHIADLENALKELKAE